MPMEIYFFEAEDCTLTEEAGTVLQGLGTLQVVKQAHFVPELNKILDNKESSPQLFFLPLSLHTPDLAQKIAKSKSPAKFFWVGNSSTLISHIPPESLEQKTLISTLALATADTRTAGIKSMLAKGSTIYSESFFSLNGIGYKLDAFLKFIRTKLGAATSISAWSSLHAAIFTAFQTLQGDYQKDDKGERVDLQLGVDSERICIGIRCPYNSGAHEGFLANLNAMLTKKELHFFEVRSFAKDGKMEIVLVYLPDATFTGTTKNFTALEAAPLENPSVVKEYQFRDFHSLAETVKISKQILKAAEEEAKNAEAMPSSPTSFLNSNDASEKIKSLERLLKLRDETVDQLQRELGAIKDPLRMDVISSVQNNQVEGLKDNIKRLETELAEAVAREKEAMAVTARAVALKDEVIKKNKELELKVQKSSESTGSRVQLLEQQIEAAQKVNTDLKKKFAELNKKLNDRDKKVA